MAPHYSDFKDLKRTVSIAHVLAHKGLMPRFRTRGDKLTGPCPVHGGDNPGAFVADLSKNLWYCFTRCNSGGDVIEFVRKMDSISHRQVAQYLLELSGGMPENHSRHPSPEKPFRPFTRRLALDPCSQFLEKKQIRPMTARWFEAGSWNGPGFLQDCIGVRLHDPKGNPLGYAGRRTHPADIERYGKWKFPTGLPKSSLLYNYHRVRSYTGRGLVIVECPWGVMRLAQLAVPAVALLGTSLSKAQIDLLRHVPRIILMLDGDTAGKNAIQRIRDCFDSVTQLESFQLPEGLDPDDLDDSQLNNVTRLFLS